MIHTPVGKGREKGETAVSIIVTRQMPDDNGRFQTQSRLNL